VKPDDGLKAPAGYEIERWQDGSPRLVNPKKYKGWWLGQNGGACDHDIPNSIASHGIYRVELKKLPERKLLNFREAVAALRDGKRVKVEGIACTWAGPRDTFSAQSILDYIDRTDFYVEEPT